MPVDERLLAMFRNSPVAVAVNRFRDGVFVDVNVAFTKLLGWERDECIGRTTVAIGIVAAEEALQLRARLEAERSVRDAELNVRTRNGEARHILLGGELTDFDGEAHAITSFVDITARKIEEISAARLVAIVESSDDAIVGKDLSGVVTSWNRGAQRVFGYTSREMRGASSTRLIPPDRIEEEQRILATIGRGETVAHFETQRLTKDGRLIDVTLSMSPIKDASGKVVGVSSFSRDITEQKRFETAQRAAEARYRALFDYAPDGIVIADRESIYLDANASICKMLGYSHDELVGLRAADIVSVEETPHIDEALEVIHADAPYQREWRFRRKDGTLFPADVIATTMPDGNLMGMIRDISERKRLEAERRATDARFRRLVESNVQGVMFWDINGSIVDANDAYLRILGYTRSELTAGKIRSDVITPPEYAAADARARAEVAARGVCTPFEKEYIRKDGSRVPVLVGSAVFEDNPNQGVGFVLDLTERKKIEHQLLRIQRMESIGTLAGGIAHDLNNVLAPILMGVDMLSENVDDAEGRDMLDLMRGCASRGASLVSQLLTFARGVEGRRVPVNVSDVLGDLAKVLRDTLPKTIEMRLAPAAHVWSVRGDPTQLHQVFLNLCLNARDAMPDGGVLTISTETVFLDEAYAGMYPDAHPGVYVTVQFSDTGTGIPAGMHDRIFEPFFTTKELGKGTGLGLSTTMAIVKSHGGFIHLYSEMGHGSRFKVYLPADSESEAPGRAVAEQPALPRGNGELVLVVDDEEAIRTIVQRMLTRYGYRVLLAANGAEAVALYAQRGAEIGVVLTDMAMPVMDGMATIAALKVVNPLVRMIASSGLATTANMASAMGAGVRHFVPKPYTAEAMLTVIDAALHEGPNAGA